MQTDQIGIQEMEKESTGTEQAGPNYKGLFVPPEMVPQVWAYILPHIEAAAVHCEGELEPEDFYPDLVSGEMQLWLVLKGTEVAATVITQIIPYPRKKILRILCLGGKQMRDWYFLFDQIENYAILEGCVAIEAWARKGFERVLTDWKSSYQVLTKELRKH